MIRLKVYTVEHVAPFEYRVIGKNPFTNRISECVTFSSLAEAKRQATIRMHKGPTLEEKCLSVLRPWSRGNVDLGYLEQAGNGWVKILADVPKGAPVVFAGVIFVHDANDFQTVVRQLAEHSEVRSELLSTL